MGNQLHLSLLSWIVDYQKNIAYSDRSFVISDEYFHAYHELLWQPLVKRPIVIQAINLKVDIK